MQCIEDCAESEKLMAVWVQSGSKWTSCLPSWSCGCCHCLGSQDWYMIISYAAYDICSLGEKIKIPSMVSTECVLVLQHLEVRPLKLGTLCGHHGRCCAPPIIPQASFHYKHTSCCQHLQHPSCQHLQLLVWRVPLGRGPLLCFHGEHEVLGNAC